MFARLFRDMAACGLLPESEQQAGTTVPKQVEAGDAYARAREATPVPYLPGHAGKDL